MQQHKYKLLILSVTLLLCTTNGFTQKAGVLALEVEKGEYKSQEKDFNYLGEQIGFRMEYTPTVEGVLVGLGLRTNIDSTDFNYFELYGTLGKVIKLSSKRLNFPVSISAGYVRDEFDSSKLTGFSFSLRAGARLFITNNLAVQGSYNLGSHLISKIDGASTNTGNTNVPSFEYPTFNYKTIGVGITYTFSVQ